ncbi:MAG: hypothetical protein ACM3JD_13195 [Rudaea sp.]
MDGLANLVPLVLIVIAAVVVGWFAMAGRHFSGESKRPKSAAGPFERQKPAPITGHTLQIDRDPDRTIFWCDGVPYGSLDEIPDSRARERAQEMLAQDATAPREPAVAELTVQVVVNGVAYNSLDEIRDPEIRQAVMQRLGRQPDQIASP